MVEKNPIKVQGLVFGRAFQRAYKTALLYTADHSGSEAPLQQAYDSLNSLLKQTKQFTFGFSNKRVLLNSILTPDDSMGVLEAEFSKREIAAVSFSVGISFRDFRRGVALLTTKPEAIQQTGGIRAFIRKNMVEGIVILAGEKKASQTADTTLEMDAQSYLMAQAILDASPGAAMPSLQLFLQEAGIEPSGGFGGSATEVLELAGKAVPASLANPDSDPQQTIHFLARVLEDMTPDFLLSALNPDRQTALRGRPVVEVATELAEDMSVQWAVNRLSAAQGGPAAVGTEDEVTRVLGRAIQTTQVAERLLQKLTRLIREANLPAEIQDRIQKKLIWFTLSREEKYDHLMSVDQFDDGEFRCLMDYVEQAGREGNLPRATEIANHYLSSLNAVPLAARAAGLARMPELLGALTSAHTLAFVKTLVQGLGRELMDPAADRECHRQVARCLSSAAQNASRFEEFEAALRIGMDLEASLERDPGQHSDCCAPALRELLPEASLERMLELWLKKRTDPVFSKTVASFLKWAGARGGEIVLQSLEDETSATNRIRLVRLAAQLGPDMLEAARKRLEDPRWFVVRNACNVLSALDDEHLPELLEKILLHSDVRVQQAAVTALAKSKAPSRAETLAKALLQLQPHLQEMVFDELIHLKDPATVFWLEIFLRAGSSLKAGILEKAVQALAAVSTDSAVEALRKVLYDAGQPPVLRRAALAGLKGSPLPAARQVLTEFSQLADPLAEEYRKMAAAKKR